MSLSRPAVFLDLPLLGSVAQSTYITDAVMLCNVMPTASVAAIPEEGLIKRPNTVSRCFRARLHKVK